jgi:Bacteriophage probable baseplate hub protein
MADSPASIRAARPAISVGGQEQPFLAEGLITLAIHEDVDGLFTCEVSFGNWGNVEGRADFLYFDRRTFDFGKTLSVKIGTEPVFDGRITALEAHFPDGAAPHIAVLAEDRFQDLRMTRRTRSFVDVTDADVMKQIAADHGLTPEVTVAGPQHRVLAQVNQSDLAFLRDRARAVGVELWVGDGRLHAAPRSGRGQTSVRLVYRRELREFSALSDLAGQRTTVAVNGWDVASKTALTYEATDAAISSEVGSQESGVSILTSALGERKESIAHGMPVTSDEARARAEAHFRLIARRFVTGRGVAEPDPRLRVGASADLQQLGPLFSGKYFVADVRHLFDTTHGMRTEFTAERPGIGRR